MNRGTRFRQLLAQPAYRTKLAFFLILGIAIFLLSALLRSVSAFWSDLLLEFAVVFDAAALIQFLWDFLGGDPMEIRTRDIQGDIAHARGIIDSRLSNTLDDLGAELGAPKQSMHLLADLMDTNIGIERIWPSPILAA